MLWVQLLANVGKVTIVHLKYKIVDIFQSLEQILGHDSIWKRKHQAQKLKKALSANEDVHREKEIHIFFPRN